MNRKEKRFRKQVADKIMSRPVGEWQQVDLNSRNHPDWMTRSFQNNRYVVMIADKTPTTHGNAIRVLVQRHDDEPIPKHWSEMQKIKNELFGKETTAIEYYPKESTLINDHNIYWMWIFEEGIIPSMLLNLKS